VSEGWAIAMAAPLGSAWSSVITATSPAFVDGSNAGFTHTWDSFSSSPATPVRSVRPSMTRRSGSCCQSETPSASWPKQWAAVITVRGPTATPPQNWPERAAPKRVRLDSATTHGS